MKANVLPLLLVTLMTSSTGFGTALPPADELAKMTVRERREKLTALPKEERAKVLAGIPAEVLLEFGRESVEALGVYRMKLTKDERIDGKFHGPQTLDVIVREKPMALRAEVVAGPAKGRRMLYNQKLRPNELRAKEAGVLGLAGAVWLDLDSGMARRDTKHPITDLRLGSLFDLLEKDMKAALPFGGFARTDEGMDAKGQYRIRFDAPAKATGLYSRSALLVIDPSSSLIAALEVSGPNGVFEKFQYEITEAGMKLTDDDFSQKAAKL